MEEKSLSNFVGTHPEKPYRATLRKLIFYPTPPYTPPHLPLITAYHGELGPKVTMFVN